MKDTMIGVDLAKRVFQLHGAAMTGEVKFRKKLTRDQFRVFMAAQPAALVVFEACGSASYWAREMEALGHEVRLIAPQYVRPFLKRQKNDAADAEAIVIAARQPEMRFVAPKTANQQAKAVLIRSRERLVHQRTELVNALRAVLYEYGHVFPVGICHLKRMETALEDSHCDPPALVIAECQDLLAQIAEKTERVEEKTEGACSGDRYCAASADHAGGRPADGAGGRSLRARHGAVQIWPGFCGVAGSRAAPALDRRQGAAGADIQGRPERHPAAADHRRDDTDHGTATPQGAGRELDRTEAGAQLPATIGTFTSPCQCRSPRTS